METVKEVTGYLKKDTPFALVGSLDCHPNLHIHRKGTLEPWLMWLSGMSIGLQTKRSLVRFLVGAHAWVADQVPRWGCSGGNWLMFLSLSFSLPLLSLKINKYNLPKNVKVHLTPKRALGLPGRIQHKCRFILEVSLGSSGDRLGTWDGKGRTPYKGFIVHQVTPVDT